MPIHPEYKEQWSAAGYSLPLGSETVCCPPPKDFIRVYHLTSAEYALAAITLGRLKVARFADLNDPFELLALALKGDRRRQVMRDFKDSSNKTQGLLCFSGDWMNPVLWSHYGNKHRGICLGFNLRRSKVETVDYEDERIRQELDGEKGEMRLTPELQRLLRCTKYSHWKYENERRLFVELAQAVKEGPLYFWNFDDDLALAEVILGVECRLPLARVRQVVSAHHPDAVTFQARLGVKQFQIVRDEVSVP